MMNSAPSHQISLTQISRPHIRADQKSSKSKAVIPRQTQLSTKPHHITIFKSTCTNAVCAPQATTHRKYGTKTLEASIKTCALPNSCSIPSRYTLYYSTAHSGSIADACTAQAIGHITSSVPFSILPLGNTFQVTTALEYTVQTYDVRKLNLIFVSSPSTPGIITQVVAYKDVVYAAFADQSGDGVWVFKRGKKVRELQQPAQKWGAWIELILFGEWVVGAFERALVVWKTGGEVYTEIEIGGRGGAIVAVCHPSAYLNKLVVARRNGDLEIWNVKTRYFTSDHHQ